jgi:hypothetical protein
MALCMPLCHWYTNVLQNFLIDPSINLYGNHLVHQHSQTRSSAEDPSSIELVSSISSWSLSQPNHSQHTTQSITTKPKMTAAAGALILKMVIAAFSGMGAATVCHPLDVIRVQMQTEGNTYKGFNDAAAGIYRKDGIKDGLFAGVSAGEFFCT